MSKYAVCHYCGASPHNKSMTEIPTGPADSPWATYIHKCREGCDRHIFPRQRLVAELTPEILDRLEAEADEAQGRFDDDGEELAEQYQHECRHVTHQVLRALIDAARRS